MRPDTHFFDIHWKGQSHGTGEGLFFHMRMHEHPVAKAISVQIENLPSVRIMFPSFVGMTDGHAEPENIGIDLHYLDVDHIRLSRENRA